MRHAHDASQARKGADLVRGRYAFALLLDRRIWLFIAADLVAITQGLFTALLQSNGRIGDLYLSMCVLPMLLLGVPVLSSAVALERRAGSLDLALAVPSTERYFLRRIAPISLFLVAQSWLLLLVACLIVWEATFLTNLWSVKGFFLLPIFLHTLLVACLAAAVTLFWASRISTTGATMVASFITLLLLSKWVLASPALSGWGAPGTWWLGFLPPALLTLVWNLAVLALAAALFYLYARERLRRPEALLA